MSPETHDEQYRRVRDLLPEYAAGLLGGEARAAVARHLEGCDECRRELAAWRAIAGAVRAADPRATPAVPFTAAWEDLRDRLPAREPATASWKDRTALASHRTRLDERPAELDLEVSRLPDERRPPGGSGAKRLWSALVAAAAVLLVVVGFAQLFARGLGGDRPPAGATATATPVPLAWQEVRLPDGLSVGSAGVYPAPGDGNRGYICARESADNSGPVKVWATQDGGAPWSRAADVPATHAGGCRLAIDATDPQRVLAIITWYEQGTGSHSLPSTQSFFSADGGGTWHALASAPSVVRLASNGGVTYGLVDASPLPNHPLSLSLSTDGIQGWRAIDGPIRGASQSVANFWMNLGDGSLLAQTDEGALWETHDQGVHWAQLPDSGLRSYVVQRPASGEPWHICGADRSANILKCSSDGGRTWKDLPRLDAVVHCDSCAKGKPADIISTIEPVAVADDGAFLVQLATRYSDQGDVFSLYRLTAGGAQWQLMGEIPGAGGEPVTRLPWLGHTLWASSGGGLYTALYPW